MKSSVFVVVAFRWVALGLFGICLLLFALSFVPLPEDWVPLLVLEFVPRGLFLLGMLPLLLVYLRPRRWWVVALLALAVLPWATDYQLAGCVKDHTDGDGFYVGSYNVGAGPVSPTEVMLWYQLVQLDVLALQETYRKGQWREVAREFGLNMACQGRLCLLSDHELVASEQLSRQMLDGWGGYMAKFDVCRGGDCIDFVNVHLNTPRHAIEAVLRGAPNARIKRMMSDRATESSIASLGTDDPMGVIAGDFNMTQHSGLYRRYWAQWKNAFEEAGCGRGATKFTRRFSARIDHILIGKGYQAASATVHEALGGDHRPVTARLFPRGSQSDTR